MSAKQLNLFNPIAKEANELARARFDKGSALGYRAAVVLASMIKKTDRHLDEYEITANLLHSYNLATKDRKRIEKTMTEMSQTSVFIEKDNELISFPYFGKVRYDKKTRKLYAKLNVDLGTYLFNLKSNFTRIPVAEYMHLTTTYTQKLYVFLLSWRSEPEKTIEINELHDLVGSKAYIRKDYDKLSQKILIPAHTQITNCTSLLYQWEPIRHKGKITFIRFVFSIGLMEQLKLKLALEKDYKDFEKSLSQIPKGILKDMPWTKDRNSKEFQSKFKEYQKNKKTEEEVRKESTK